MATPLEDPASEISIVVPVVERHGELRQLFSEYAAEISKMGRRAEFIFVVDHRQQQVLPVLREIQQTADQEVILVRLGGTFGESVALTVGVEQARGEILVTLASYFQIEPSGLEAAIQEIESGADLVVGCRSPRIDSWFNRLQSRVFHSIVNLMTGTRFRDISSGFRVMRRAVPAELPVYGGIHRFFPVLAQRRGFDVREVEIPQRQEDAPTRYYGIGVYLKRLLDVLTVFFLLKFTHRPLRFFGVVSLLLVVPGMAITAFLGVYRLLGLGPIAQRPLLLLGVLMIVLGIQLLSIGLIGEMIVFSHARQLREYRIAEIIGHSSAESTAKELSGV
jgi:glycosyltransferase involved in cell wall biosynthesis